MCTKFSEDIIWEYDRLKEMKNTEFRESNKVVNTPKYKCPKFFPLWFPTFQKPWSQIINYKYHILNIIFGEVISYIFQCLIGL